MLRKCKYFLLSFIFFVSSFLPCMYSYAQGSEWTSSEKTRFFAEGFYKIVTDICGLILPTGLGGQNLQQDYQNYVLNNDWIQSNMTYDEWIASQISGAYVNGSSGNSDVTFSADLQNSLIAWANNYTDSANFTFIYSGGNQIVRNSYSNDNQYNNTISFINTHDDDLILCNYDNRIYVGNNTPDYFVKSSYSSDPGRPSFYCQPFKNGSSISITYTVYSLNYGNNEWSVYGTEYDRQIFAFKEPTTTYPYSMNSWGFLTDSNITQYICYDSAQDAQNSNISNLSYYVTDSFKTYNENSLVTNDYSTTTNSINNSISYGDVQNYANNYYVENNSYPTTNNVFNYINTYVPPDNGGDNGDDNGGGGSNIFDFLGTIGEFLGNLIEGIGNVLSGILSAITDVIDMFIGENGLPNVIGELISYFLPFLPDWIPTVIGLSVMLALLIGIVKLIRGS